MAIVLEARAILLQSHFSTNSNVSYPMPSPPQGETSQFPWRRQVSPSCRTSIVTISKPQTTSRIFRNIRPTSKSEATPPSNASCVVTPISPTAVERLAQNATTKLLNHAHRLPGSQSTVDNLQPQLPNNAHPIHVLSTPVHALPSQLASPHLLPLIHNLQ